MIQDILHHQVAMLHAISALYKQFSKPNQLHVLLLTFCGVTHFSQLICCQRNIYLFTQQIRSRTEGASSTVTTLRLKCGRLVLKHSYYELGAFHYFNIFCRYSFCVPPKLDLHVRPKLGEREVTFCHVTEWIEKKLQNEFQVEGKKSSIFYDAMQILTFIP